MMGYKVRRFGPIGNLTLEELVPGDHFYRHLEKNLDLTFVRDLVRTRYAAFGRPSIDPVVFFKLHLVLFFEGMRSERQLERVGVDRLSVRWYLGYDLHEPLPDHSSRPVSVTATASRSFANFSRRSSTCVPGMA